MVASTVLPTRVVHVAIKTYAHLFHTDCAPELGDKYVNEEDDSAAGQMRRGAPDICRLRHMYKRTKGFTAPTSGCAQRVFRKAQKHKNNNKASISL